MVGPQAADPPTKRQPTEDPSDDHLAAVARGGALNLAGAVASAVSGFVLVVLVANNYDERQAGLLFSTVSVFLIAVAVSSLGTDTGLARFVLPMLARGDGAGVRRIIRNALRATVGVSLVIAASTLLAAPAVRDLLGLDESDGAHFLRIFAVALPFAVLAEFWLGSTRAFGRMRPTVVIDNLLRTILQVLGVAIAAAVVASTGWLAVGWAAPYVLAGVLAAAVGVRVARNATNSSRDPSPAAVAPTDPDPGRFWSFTAPRAVARVSQIALQRIDIVLVAVLVGAADAAVYTAATRFVVLGQFASQAIQRVLQPRFSSLLASGDRSVVHEVFRRSTAWGMILSWPLYAVAAGAAPTYLSVFGPGYDEGAVPVVVVMAVAMMLAIAAGPLDTLLLMGGRSSTSLAITVAALAIDVVLCVVLLPPMGIAGAALAWAAAVLFRNAATFVAVRRMSDVSPFSGGSALVAIASVVCFALPLGLLSMASDGEPGLLSLALVATAGGACYLAALYMARDALALTSLRAVLPRRFR